MVEGFVSLVDLVFFEDLDGYFGQDYLPGGHVLDEDFGRVGVSPAVMTDQKVVNYVIPTQVDKMTLRFVPEVIQSISVIPNYEACVDLTSPQMLQVSLGRRHLLHLKNQIVFLVLDVFGPDLLTLEESRCRACHLLNHLG